MNWCLARCVDVFPSIVHFYYLATIMEVRGVLRACWNRGSIVSCELESLMLLADY